jgi:hypothetical protein
MRGKQNGAIRARISHLATKESEGRLGLGKPLGINAKPISSGANGKLKQCNSSVKIAKLKQFQ